MVNVGDIYRSSTALEVGIWLAIAAPVTISYTSILPANEPFVVTDLSAYFGEVCCIPENYDALHDYFVDKKERDRINRAYFNRYEGYVLTISPDVIEKLCERLEVDDSNL